MSFELQNIDCNCNDCLSMQRDIEKYNFYNHLHTLSNGQIQKSSHRVQYGDCLKLTKSVSFIPNTCQIDTQLCFTHRKLNQ